MFDSKLFLAGILDIDLFFTVAVPSDSRYSDVEIRSNEMVICSEITAFFSLEKHEWSKITRNSNRSSATIQNKRDGNMEWLHLGMVLIMEEETLGLGKDHSKVYWTDGKNIAGYYLRLDWEIEQQRN